MMNESVLARKEGLSRRTLSVTRDAKRSQVIVVEQVSQEESVDNPGRQEVYYRIYDDVETIQLNAMIQDAKDYATREFMGVETSVETVSQCDTVTAKTITDAPTKQEIEKAAKKAAKDALAAERKVKAAAKKAATAKAAETSETATPEPAAKGEEPFGDDDLGAMEDTETPAAEILYNKGNREHASQLKPLLLSALGKDWKTDPAKMQKARELISKVNGSVGVTDVEGEVLPSFVAYCEAQLK